MPLKSRIVIFLLIIATISGSFSRYFLYAGFELNQKYIAANLCENRDKPWLHCNGKCYFMKKIKLADENEKKQEAKDNLSRLEVSFFQEKFSFAFQGNIEPERTQNEYFNYTYQYTSQYIDTIFRPPKTVA